MERRRFLIAGLAGTLARPADAARSTPPPEMTRPEEPLLGDVEATVEDIQYGPPGRGRGRRHRCWIETRRVPFRDRWGRLRYRILEREVCR